MKKILLYLVPAVLIVTVGAVLFKKHNASEELLVVHPGDFVQQVSVSGKVIAAENVDLAFSQSARVANVYVKVGDRVSAGTLLASTENGDLRADVLQKESARDVAAAKLASLQQGTRPEQIAVAESGVASAQASHEQAVQAAMDAIRTAYTQSDDAIRHRVDGFMSNGRTAAPRLNFVSMDSSLKIDVERDRLRV